MNHRINKMWLSIKKNRGFDILLTHSPAAGIGDGPDEPHKGFEGFNYLLENISLSILSMVISIIGATR